MAEPGVHDAPSQMLTMSETFHQAGVMGLPPGGAR
jgi:hypothetical protein